MKTDQTPPRNVKHVFSVDVEDYFQVEAFAGSISREAWDQYPLRVVDNCNRLLDLLDEYGVSGTFFVLGWIAKRCPQLVSRIHERGHELACHSFWHRRVYSLSPSEFRHDLREACDAIEQAASVRVLGYRAPTWSITRQSLWALEILAEENLVYDSSIFPIHHDLYGIPNAKREPYIENCGQGNQIMEFPPATIQIGRMNVPIAGGGYLRLLPLGLTRWAFDKYEQEGKSLVLYLHPWEIDPEQPRIRAKMRSRFRHYTNLRCTYPRLQRLLADYSFEAFRDKLASNPEYAVLNNRQQYAAMAANTGSGSCLS